MNNLQATAIGIFLGGITMALGVQYAKYEKQKEIDKMVLTFQKEIDISKKIENFEIKKEIQNLRKQIQILRREIKAYKYKIDDLSQAFIRHHGNYPRTIIKENE